jgi:protein required for attachment to host cells
MSSVANMQSKFGMDEKVSPKQEEGIRFAKEVADFLKIQGADYDQLYLIAPPHFLGLIRPNLDKAVMSKLIMEIDKDLSKHSAEEILAHLPTAITG